jgi:hypothetical protein
MTTVDLPSTSNNIDNQHFSLLPENDEDGNEDEEGNNVIGIQKPTHNEKRRGSWGKLINWRNNGLKKEGKESEALISSISNGEEKEEDWNDRGVGDISTSNLSYKNNRSNITEENDANSKNTEERDLMLFTPLETAKDDNDNDNDNGSISFQSSTSVVFDETSDGRSEHSSVDSFDDLDEQSNDVNGDDNDDERGDVLSKDTSNRHRPTLTRRSLFRRSLSTTSYFIDKENNNSDILHERSSRMEGFGSSSSIPDIPSSPLTFRERLKAFADGNGGMMATQYEDDEHEVALPSRVRSSDSRDKYIARIEQELGQKVIELTSWKNRAKELEEEVNRLKGILDKH